LFATLRDALPAVLLDHIGVYAHPDIRGQSSELTVLLQTPGGAVEIQYQYGSDSQGPPAEILGFLRHCQVATQTWYETQSTARPQRSA
jgi:hypothetical protein